MNDRRTTPYNILLILTDQERRFDEYPAGVERPALDRLQEMGTTFTSHQIASAVCTPSRSVILTGQHIVNSGMFDNTNFPWQNDLSTEIPTLGDHMRAAGYYTAYKGKWHLSEEFEQPLADDTRLLSMEDYGFSDYLGIGDAIGHTRGGYEFDDITTGTVIQWLRSQGEACRDEGQPWFLMVGMVNPHDVMYFDTDTGDDETQSAKTGMAVARAPRHSHYRETYGAALPDNYDQPVNEPGRPVAHANFQRIHDMMTGPVPPDEGRLQRRQDYYLNCLREVDSHVGRMLDELDDLGLLDSTIVVYTSDHGELGGAHGLNGKGPAPYREQNNVPLVIYHPDRPGGVNCEALTSHVDLVPTMVGLSGNAERSSVLASELPGHDLSPLLDDPAEAGQHAVRDASLWAFNMFTYLDPEFFAGAVQAMAAGEEPSVRPDLEGIRGAVRSIFDGRYRYTRYFAPKRHNRPESLEQILEFNDIELFDLENDPSENHNLALDAEAHRELIEELNAKMNQLIDDEIGEDIGQMLPNADEVSWHIDVLDD